MVRVKNIHGTSKEKYAKSYPKKYKNWLDYWNNNCFYNDLVTCCQFCGGKKEVGGHVIKESKEDDSSWYIIPLCKKCNNPNNEKYFDVDEDYLVPVSDKEIKTERNNFVDDLIDKLNNMEIK